MKKKFLSILITISLIITLLPATIIKVKAIPAAAVGTVPQRIEQLHKLFPDGSYFSRNRKKCTHAARETCLECKLSSVMTNKLGYSGTYGISDANTCAAFARFAFWYLFDISYQGKGRGVYYENGKTKSAATIVKIEEARLGDLVVWSGHSGIFLGRKGEDVYLFHSNADTNNPNVVRYNSKTTHKASDVLYVVHANNYDKLNECKKHTYDTAGYCTSCKAGYSWTEIKVANESYIVSSDGAKLKTRPYEASEAGVTLNKAASVNIIASTRNHHNNLWYKIKYNNKEYWLYSSLVIMDFNAKSIKFQSKSGTFKVGSSVALVATLEPNNVFVKLFNPIKWSSSDPSVAKVDNGGLVTMLKEGKTTVTATAGGKSAEYKVEIKGTSATSSAVSSAASVNSETTSKSVASTGGQTEKQGGGASKAGGSTGTQGVFTETQSIGNVQAYKKRDTIYIENLTGEHLKNIGFESVWHKPIDSLIVLAKGIIPRKVNLAEYPIGGQSWEWKDTAYYKVNYKGSICYVLEDSVALKGSIIKMEDGASYKLGEVIYKGKNHDIVVTAEGKYIAADGCNGGLSAGGFATIGPILGTYEKFRNYADACYKDPSTGKEYPLCASKVIYSGKYGSVYVLDNITGSQGVRRSFEGFVVLRNDGYRKVISIEYVTESAKKWAEPFFSDGRGGVYWSYNAYIDIFEEAKLQADSFESIYGGVEYNAGDFAN